MQRAGIEWCTPHSLRHTGITEAVHAKDADVVDVSRLVGHKNLKTTMGYIHVADDRLHNAVSKLPKIATLYFLGVTEVGKNGGKRGGQGWNRTTDTGIFSPLLYRLSYLAATETRAVD